MPCVDPMSVESKRTGGPHDEPEGWTDVRRKGAPWDVGSGRHRDGKGSLQVGHGLSMVRAGGWPRGYTLSAGTQPHPTGIGNVLRVGRPAGSPPHFAN
jgi:hypothetical protein